MSLVQALQKKGYLGTLRITDSQTPVSKKNIIWPSGFVTQYSNIVLKAITTKLSAEELVGTKQKLLEYHQQNIQYPFVEYAGKAALYSDYSNPPLNDLNITFPSIKQIRFSTAAEIGLLEGMTFDKTMQDKLLPEKIAACIDTLNRTFNKIAFVGIPAQTGVMVVEGLLTNKKINAITNSPKQLSAAAVTAQDFVDVFNKLATNLYNKSGYIFNPQRDSWRVGISPVSYNKARLMRYAMGADNQSETVISFLKRNYPGLSIIPCPELIKYSSADKDHIVAIGDSSEVMGTFPTAMLGYSEFGLILKNESNPKLSRVEVIGTSTGCIVLKPQLVSIFKDA